MGTARELDASGGRPGLALACVGSPENGSLDAGRLIRLGGVRHVVFTRGEGERVMTSRTPQGLCVEVPLPYVSSRHAELSLAEPKDAHGHRLRDRGSRNGTHLEGQPIRADAAVVPGKIFEIGRSFWTLVELSPLDEQAGVDRLSAEGSISGRMRQVYSALARLAESPLPLLITGETGVGKNRLVHALHRASGRAGELVQVNAVSTAFAQLAVDTDDEPGLLTRAKGGTLHVDEVGELSVEEQTRLLSALMSAGEDIRIIAASTRDLRGMATVDAFRPDLLSRLAGFEAVVPPLRERREDLGILGRALCRRPDGTPVRMSTAVFRSMLAYAWPFNVRELRNTLLAAAALAGDDPQGITLSIWRTVCTGAEQETRDPARIQAVREALVRHLVAHEGDTSAVAASMHCELADVQRWLDRLDLDPQAFVSRAG